MSDPVVTRFAPSPSGHLHVGGARTALFNWAYARRRGGRFILRIEDTDRKRSSDAASMAFLEDLRWLGVDWDEGPEHDGCGGGPNGPYHQSERREHYDAAIERLIAEGRAYRAFETAEELDAQREAARTRGVQWRYDRGAAIALDDATVDSYLAEGRPHVVRFRVPDDASVTVPDVVLGDVVTPLTEIDDFVIRKADGFPTYHLAVVIDDEAMGVTHVIRGQEHLGNAAKHVLLQDALGCRRPVYAHVSLIFNPDGSKMSKRDKDRVLRRAVKERGLDAPPAGADGAPVVDAAAWSAWIADDTRQLELADAEALAAALGVHLPEIDVDDFRRAGYLPEVMVNGLALLGWSPGGDVERFDPAFLIERFDLDRVVKSPAKLDRDKLLAFNLEAIQALAPEAFVERYRAHCAAFHPEFLERLDDERFAMLARANQGRSKTLDDQIESSRFLVVDDDAVEYADTKPVRKALRGDALELLEAVAPVLEAVDSWTPEAIEAALTEFADARAEGKLGKIAQPLRIAVSGGTVSPAIFETLAILGRDATLARIRRLLARPVPETTP